MKKAVVVLEEGPKTIYTGAAHVSLFDHMQSEYYGSPTSINRVASVKVVEGRRLVIKLYDHGALKDIEHAIQANDTGLVSRSDGEVIRLNVLVLIGERHRELVKSAHKVGEKAKIATYNIRRDVNDAVKKDRELTEDLKKGAQEKIQKLTGKIGKSVDSVVNTKAKEIMKI